MEKFKQVYASALLVWSMGWILWHLWLIKKYGRVEIGEDNKLILHTELALMSGLVLFALGRFIKVVKE